MAWRRPGDKPLSEPMVVSLLTHICVTRPQRVNTDAMRSGNWRLTMDYITEGDTFVFLTHWIGSVVLTKLSSLYTVCNRQPVTKIPSKWLHFYTSTHYKDKVVSRQSHGNAIWPIQFPVRLILPNQFQAWCGFCDAMAQGAISHAIKLVSFGFNTEKEGATPYVKVGVSTWCKWMLGNETLNALTPSTAECQNIRT